MENHKDILLLYKKLGETPNQTILRYKEEHPDLVDLTMTYAGRLDPMAEGLLLVLSGDKLHVKEEYLHLTKTYEFEILWGFNTDTFDVLGKVLASNVKAPSVEELVGELKIGKILQKYPPYSSKPVSGKPLFKWAREGRLSQIEIPTHEVEVFKATHTNRRTAVGKDLLLDIKKRVALVAGDFRQEEILEKWEGIIQNKLQNEFVLDQISMDVSSGFYIRQFVEDLGKKFGTSATTFHIRRTKVGEFKI